MIDNRVSFRYARALLDTAVQGKVEDIIYVDFVNISAILEASLELRTFTSNPIIQHWKKINVYKEIFSGRISTLSMAFLLFLLDKKRGDRIQGVISQYFLQYNSLKNRLPVNIVSTLKLSEDLKTKILSNLTDITKKELLPKFSENEELHGGFLVRFGDLIYDFSVRRQLELLHKKLIAEGIS